MTRPPRLVVCGDAKALDAIAIEFGAAGRATRLPTEVPEDPWRLHPSMVVIDSEDVRVESTIELLIRGASIAVAVDDADAAAGIWDEGRRLAETEWYDAEHRPLTEGLDSSHLGLLLAISEGFDVDAAARKVNVSPRTAARRLADARARLRMGTTAAAAAQIRMRIDELRIPEVRISNTGA